MWIGWQKQPHSSSYGAVELGLAAAHRWVYLCLPSCVFILSPGSQLALKMSLLIATPFCFFLQRSFVWSSPGRLKPVTRKPLRSTHPLWPGRKQRWQFNCLKRTTPTEKSGERSADLFKVVMTDASPRLLRLIFPCLCCSLSVVVEDVSSSCCVTVKVFPYMTVAALKQQVRNLPVKQ